MVWERSLASTLNDRCLWTWTSSFKGAKIFKHTPGREHKNLSKFHSASLEAKSGCKGMFKSYASIKIAPLHSHVSNLYWQWSNYASVCYVSQLLINDADSCYNCWQSTHSHKRTQTSQLEHNVETDFSKSQLPKSFKRNFCQHNVFQFAVFSHVFVYVCSCYVLSSIT